MRPAAIVHERYRTRLRRLDPIQLRDLCRVLGLNLVDFVQRYESELSSKKAGE